jgi:hypothetical protein
MKNVISSTEGLRQLAHTLPESRSLLAEFCGVHEFAVARWFKGQHLPNGLTQIKLRVFLTLNGYRLREFEALNQTVQNFAKSLAFGVIDAKEAQTALGYEQMNGVYNVALRGGSMLPDRRYRLEKLVENAAVSLHDKELQWQERITALLPDPPAPATHDLVAALHRTVDAALGSDPVQRLVADVDKAFGDVRAQPRTEPDEDVISTPSHNQQLVSPTVKLIGALLDLTNVVNQSPNAHELRFVIGTVSAYDISQLRLWFDSLEAR